MNMIVFDEVGLGEFCFKKRICITHLLQFPQKYATIKPQ